MVVTITRVLILLYFSQYIGRRDGEGEFVGGPFTLLSLISTS